MWTEKLTQDELLDPDKMITAGEAAKILGKDRRTVSRWFHAGKLPGTKTDKGALFRRFDVLVYREQLRNKGKFGDIIKLAHVFDAFGCLEFANYSWAWDGQINDIRNALHAYDHERAGVIRPLGVDPQEVFMVEEVLARLGVADQKIVYNMVRDGVLASYDGCAPSNGRASGQRTLVTKDSFGEYLGEDIPERFFNTAYLAEEVEMPVNWVNGQVMRINRGREKAGMYPLGRKINDKRKNSNYLFTLGDICDFRDACKLY